MTADPFSSPAPVPAAFADRLALGQQLENIITAALAGHGWTVTPTAERWVPKPVRDVLPSDSGLHHMPDIYACRDRRCVWIDCKDGSPGRSNVAIAKGSLDAMAEFDAMGAEAVFVLGKDCQFRVLTVDDVLEHGREGPQTGRGSRQPYLLVPWSVGTPFLEMFVQA